MQEIKICVEKRRPFVQGIAEYICGNSDYEIVFDFDEEWNAFPQKTARFSYGEVYQDVVFQGDCCPMPVITDVRLIYIGVFAGNLRTTTRVAIHARTSVLCGTGSPAPPSEDVYAQIMEMLNRNSAAGGLPPGGKTGQVLQKKSDMDGDVCWGDLEIPEEYGLVTYDQDKTITIS